MKQIRRITAAILILLTMLCQLAFAADAAVYEMDGRARAVIAQVNAERAARGLKTLRTDAGLTAAARTRAYEIVQKFSHTRPDGTKWRTVSNLAYGENIARGQQTADKVMAAWLNSDGHRANILRSGFGSIGVCCVKAGNVYYWVQLFGK